MTPIVSYWSSKRMLWLDGTGRDRKGPCAADDVPACGETVKFYDFSVQAIAPSPARPVPAPSPAASGIPEYAKCTESNSADCRQTKCCRSPGMQCYERDQVW